MNKVDLRSGRRNHTAEQHPASEEQVPTTGTDRI
jgi:hypothetical protein